MLRGLFNRVAQGATGGAGEVTPALAWERAAAGSVLVDVREPEEWRAGHAPGAVHIPLGQLPARMGELPRDGEIVTVCRSGNRSARAADLLRRAGYQRVHNLTGGMIAWSRDGLPVAH
jgi:rhodanese-related sulfurtransferase